MSGLKKNFHINARDFIRAGEASINVQNILKSMNFDPKLIRRIAICGYEGEMNAVMHGGDGVLSIEIDEDKLVLEISDDGQGIEDIEMAMQAGFRQPKMNTVKWVSGPEWGCPTWKKIRTRSR